MLAAFIPLSLAATNLAKLLTLLFVLAAIAFDAARRTPSPAIAQSWTVRAVLAMLVALALSLTYSTATPADAVSDFGKYGKLLLIPATLLLIRTRREATIALAAYLVVQAFVVLTSWLLYFHVPVFWVPGGRNSVATAYSSYLDQSMMVAAFAALCWHLRGRFPLRAGRGVAIALAVAAVINVMLMLPGRSGQVALLGVFTLAVLWRMPVRWRFVGLAAPLALVALAMLLSPQFKTRFDLAFQEVKSYRQSDDNTTSAGMRLHFWTLSLQAIAERPLTGFGVGSWNQQYLRLQDQQAVPGTEQVRNPHQEFLLWGVHLGVGGTLLVMLLLAAMVRDTWRFSTPTRQAAQSVIAVMTLSALFNSVLFDAVTGEFFCITIGLILVYGLRELDAPGPVAATA